MICAAEIATPIPVFFLRSCGVVWVVRTFDVRNCVADVTLDSFGVLAKALHPTALVALSVIQYLGRRRVVIRLRLWICLPFWHFEPVREQHPRVKQPLELRAQPATRTKYRPFDETTVENAPR